MSRRIYVAAPLTLLAEARTMAERLIAAGHVVVSTWHVGSPTVAQEAGMDAADRMDLADTCVDEIYSSDALVLLYGPLTSRHGSVFEAGLAAGSGIRVFAVPATPDAVLPTILLWAGGVGHHGVDDVLAVLS